MKTEFNVALSPDQPGIIKIVTGNNEPIFVSWMDAIGIASSLLMGATAAATMLGVEPEVYNTVTSEYVKRGFNGGAGV